MDGSCHGRGACFNGVIPTIVNSCNGTRACSGVAANKGKAGHFESSCVGDRVCEFAGASGFTAGVSSGVVSNITKSCIGYRACYGAGAGVGFGYSTGPIVSVLNNCCSGSKICQFANDTTIQKLCPAEKPVL